MTECLSAVLFRVRRMRNDSSSSSNSCPSEGIMSLIRPVLRNFTDDNTSHAVKTRQTEGNWT